MSQPRTLKTIIPNQNWVRSKYKNPWNSLDPAKPLQRKNKQNTRALPWKTRWDQRWKIKTKRETKYLPKWKQNRTLKSWNNSLFRWSISVTFESIFPKPQDIKKCSLKDLDLHLSVIIYMSGVWMTIVLLLRQKRILTLSFGESLVLIYQQFRIIM